MNICPHCESTMPKGFLVCRACWRALPFLLRAVYWTESGKAHHKELYPNAEAGLAESVRAIMKHLKTGTPA